MVARAQPPIKPPSSGISRRGSPFSPPETATTAKYVTPPANAPANIACQLVVPGARRRAETPTRKTIPRTLTARSRGCNPDSPW